MIISLGYLYMYCCISNWGEEGLRGVHEGIRKFSKYRYFFGRGNKISGDYLFQNVLTNDLDLDNPIFPSSLIFTHYFHHF